MPDSPILFIEVDTTSGPQTYSLPSNPVVGVPLFICNIGPNNATIAGGAFLIAGKATLVLTAPGASAILVFGTGAWRVF